eukprot:8617896-Heterocapsa_arctica.AAC.1
MCGAPHTNPTELLAVGLPSLPRRIRELAAGGICDRTHKHASLAGRHEDGTYRTAAAKEYPPGLCRIMVQAVLDAVQLHLALLPEGDGEAVADDDYSHFFMPLDPYATYVMQHDCAGGVAA